MKVAVIHELPLRKNQALGYILRIERDKYDIERDKYDFEVENSKK